MKRRTAEERTLMIMIAIALVAWVWIADRRAFRRGYYVGIGDGKIIAICDMEKEREASSDR